MYSCTTSTSPHKTRNNMPPCRSLAYLCPSSLCRTPLSQRESTYLHMRRAQVTHASPRRATMGPPRPSALQTLRRSPAGMHHRHRRTWPLREGQLHRRRMAAKRPAVLRSREVQLGAASDGVAARAHERRQRLVARPWEAAILARLAEETKMVLPFTKLVEPKSPQDSVLYQ